MRLSELTEGMLSEIEHLYGPPNPNSAVVQLVRDYRAVREELQQVQERITTADNSIVYLLSQSAAAETRATEAEAEVRETSKIAESNYNVLLKRAIEAERQLAQARLVINDWVLPESLAAALKELNQ